MSLTQHNNPLHLFDLDSVLFLEQGHTDSGFILFLILYVILFIRQTAALFTGFHGFKVGTEQNTDPFST